MSPAPEETQPVPTPAAEPLPEQIGRYRILDRLGAGGMGTVYKAHDPQLDRVVALKLPRFDGPPADRTVRVQRFQREARAAAQIWHPHVCPIFDVGEHDGHPYVVMACVLGQSLSRRLAERGRYEDVGEAVALILQVLAALDAVHAHGIIHRDLKPGNILLDEAGRAVLTDFGLARPEHDVEHLTSDGVVIGTPAYMAPEQAAGQSDRIGPWTDGYSAAVVLYQMLTGRLPFEGPPLQVLARIAHEPPVPPSRWRSDLDPALEALLLQAMAREISERYQTARELATALQSWAAGAKSTPAARPNGPEVAGPSGAPTRSAALPAGRPYRLTTPAIGRFVTVVCVAIGIPLVAWGALISAGLIYAGDAEHELIRSVGEPLLGLGLGIWLAVTLLYSERYLLIAASLGGRCDVRHLLNNGLSANTKDELGDTALMRAAQNGRTEIVKLLLTHGADARAENRFGQTARKIATAKGHGDIVELIAQAESLGAAQTAAVPRRVPRWALLLTALAGIALGLGVVFLVRVFLGDARVSYEEFLSLAREGKLKKVTLVGRDRLIGEARDPGDGAIQKARARKVVTIPEDLGELHKIRMADRSQFTLIAQRDATGGATRALLTVGVVGTSAFFGGLLFLALMWLLLRR